MESTDVYDGKVWKDFMTVNDVPFLCAPYNFAFQLNVDWFQPFKHTQHSEGAIYLSILNLPLEERFLKEKVILVGIIPGPKEPALHMNSFLQPLVDELKELWEGVIVSIPNKISTIILAELICVAVIFLLQVKCAVFWDIELLWDVQNVCFDFQQKHSAINRIIQILIAVNGHPVPTAIIALRPQTTLCVIQEMNVLVLKGDLVFATAVYYNFLTLMHQECAS